MRNRASAAPLALAFVAAAAPLLAGGCLIEDFDADDFSGIALVCEEDIVNDPAFREVVRLAPGARSRDFHFTGFPNATCTAEVRILDGSASWSLGVRVAGPSGQVHASGAIASPDAAFQFTVPPAAEGRNAISLENAGSATLLFEFRRLTARGPHEDHAFGINIHFAGPLGGLAPAQVSATAADLVEGLRATFEPLGIAVADVRTFEHTTPDLRAAGVPVDRNGNAALIPVEPDFVSPSCGAGAVAILGFQELERLARTDDDNIDIFLIGSFEDNPIIGVAPQGGRFRGTEGAGVAVALLRADGRPNTMSLVIRVAVHEIGHFLSLPHTSDYDPATGTFEDDGFPDTPSCAAFEDRDGDGRPGVGEDCPDESHVMFPRLTGGVLFSEGQVEAMRAWIGLVPHAAFGVPTPTAAPFGFDTVQLPEAYADRPYTTGILVRGGAAPVTVAIESGTLPAGLTLTADGHLSGATQLTGESRIVVRATDSTAGTPQSVTRTYFVEACPEPLAAFYLPQVWTRPALGTDVHVFPFAADGSQRALFITATGGEGRYRFIFPPATSLDPDTGVFLMQSAAPLRALDFLAVSDVNRTETRMGLIAGD